MRKNIFLGLFSLWVFSLCAAPVAIIQGNTSLPQGERRFAASLARHIERWYRAAGVQTILAEDTNLRPALNQAQIAALVYLSQPSAQQLSEISSFIRRGGKVIVFYSSSPALAQLMGMQSVGYLKGTTDGRWSQMRFSAQRPRGVPESILQTSSNLFVVHPISGSSQVLAWWHDRQGHRTTEPAWLQSPQGFWMTHILTADGEASAKGQLLLALAALHDPGLWLPAANGRLQQALAVAGGTTRLTQLLSQVPDTRRRANASAGLQKIRAQEQQVRNLIKAGQGYEACTQASNLKDRMYEVYGQLQPTRKGEMRAVWDHSGMGLFPGNWPQTCQMLKNAGITDLFVNVAGAGFAYYNSSVLPRAKVFDEQGDQLAACLAAAKPLGLRVHAWVLVFSTERATQERLAIFHKNGWLLTTDSGAPRPWIDPAVPQARSYMERAVQELFTKYAVAGVHLDFVRYPDFNSSLGKSVQPRFEQALGRKLPHWPAEVKTGAARAEFIHWRAKQITDFVQGVRLRARREAPAKLLTAAVFGKYPSCYDAVGQDWESWINIDLVDYVVPMNYTEDLNRFNEWLAAQTRTRKQTLRVLPGLGITAAESRLDAAQVIDQIGALRRAGCPGFALFDLNMTLYQEILPILRLGITAQPM